MNKTNSHQEQNYQRKIEAMQKAITLGLESENVKDFDIRVFTKQMLKESQVDKLQ